MNENRKFYEWQIELENSVRAANNKTLIHNMRKCIERRDKYPVGSMAAGKNYAIMEACYRAYKAKRCRTKNAALERIPDPWECGIDYDQHYRYLTLNERDRATYFKWRGSVALTNISKSEQVSAEATSKKTVVTAGVM